MSGNEVRAAGGVVRRQEPSGSVQVLLVHRPRYDDWSLPKGKLHGSETFEDAALREVHEETGLRCALGHELRPVRYRDAKDRPKVVRYWTMRPVADDGFTSGDEVDATRWLEIPEAVRLLSYEHDRALLGELRDAAPG